VKKLLALAILSAVFLAEPCFGIDWLRDRIYYSLSGSTTIGAKQEIGYHYTDSTKISIGLMNNDEYGAGLGEMIIVKFQYHHKFASTDITPYVNAGTGIVKVLHGDITDINTFFVLCQVGAGINLPLSSGTSVFAGYNVQKFERILCGFEFGMIFNL